MSFAPDRLHIEQLELWAQIGVPDEERAQPQRLTVTLTLEPSCDFSGLKDDVAKTIDYSDVCRAVQAIAGARSRKLIETLAVEIAAELLAQYPIRTVDVELRKYVVPDISFFAVRIHRQRSSQ